MVRCLILNVAIKANVDEQGCGLDLGSRNIRFFPASASVVWGSRPRPTTLVRMVEKVRCFLLHPSTAVTTVKAFSVSAVVIKLAGICFCHQRHYHHSIYAVIIIIIIN